MYGTKGTQSFNSKLIRLKYICPKFLKNCFIGFNSILVRFGSMLYLGVILVAPKFAGKHKSSGWQFQ